MKQKKGKKFWIGWLMAMMLLLLTACGQSASQGSATPKEESPKGENRTLILATTTSTENSGLLDDLLPIFKEDTGIEVKVVAVGTGQALKLGKDGEADALLVHAKASEEEFIKAGHGLERFDVMYNDFVLVGPKGDGLSIKEQAGQDIVKALTTIAKNKGKFLSRGDDSGTHKAELSYWKAAGIEPSAEDYISVGKGMGDTLLMANEMEGYTISDRATFLAMKDKVDMEILVEGDSRLFNQYGVIAVNPNKNNKIHHQEALEWVKWILSEKTQQRIGEFGKDIYGQSLFIPNAK